MAKLLALCVLLFAAVPAFGDAERDCTRLIMDYAVLRDAGQARAYADLFTEDATLTVLGQTYRGRQQIFERLRDASPQTSMHLMSTIRVYLESAHEARGVSYAEVYIAPHGERPVAADRPAGIGIYHDRFRLTDQGWRIASREFEQVLAFADGG